MRTAWMAQKADATAAREPRRRRWRRRRCWHACSAAADPSASPSPTRPLGIHLSVAAATVRVGLTTTVGRVALAPFSVRCRRSLVASNCLYAGRG